MKIKPLAVIVLVMSFISTGCDDEKKTDCQKDPAAKGCPHYSGNIITSKSKSWGMQDLDPKESTPSKEDK